MVNRFPARGRGRVTGVGRVIPGNPSSTRLSVGEVAPLVRGTKLHSGTVGGILPIPPKAQSMTERKSRRRTLKPLGTGSLVTVAGCIADELDGGVDDSGDGGVDDSGGGGVDGSGDGGDPTATPGDDGSAEDETRMPEEETPTPEEETPTPEEGPPEDLTDDLLRLGSDDDLFDPDGALTFEGSGTDSTDERVLPR